MTIVLHIGISKTGSSAIQYALAQHREALEARGLHYAVDGAVALAEKRLITSGNGALLARRLDPRRGVEPASEALDFDDAFVSPRQPISLVSSEGLSSADPELLARFNTEVIAGREVRIVAFVRDLYGHALAAWMQRIKRHGYTGRFEHFCAKTYDIKKLISLDAYAAVFGRERMQVIHYDSVKGSVFHALLSALGVPGEDLAAPPKVNRSLTRAETEVLIACNQIHKGMQGLSARISDHLIYKHPDRPTDEVRSERAEAMLGERFQADIDGINQRFFDGRAVLRVGGPKPSQAAPVEDREDVWADAVEALGQRLISVEAERRALQPSLDTIPELMAQRDALREEVARLKGQSAFDRLKVDLARSFKGSGRARAAQD